MVTTVRGEGTWANVVLHTIGAHNRASTKRVMSLIALERQPGSQLHLSR